jgi:long-subunit fatty acid transport protein
MKNNQLQLINKFAVLIFFFGFSLTTFAQEVPSSETQKKSDFWDNVQFGGGLGLGFGSGYSNITVAPSAIYNVNKYFSAGLGVQYSYLKQKNFYSSSMYGASVIGLINPIDEIQLSVELEQLRVNLDFDGTSNNSQDFWNTGLFVGAGYRAENVTIGARYNLLFDKDKGVYGDALMPFVRFYF